MSSLLPTRDGCLGYDYKKELLYRVTSEARRDRKKRKPRMEFGKR